MVIRAYGAACRQRSQDQHLKRAHHFASGEAGVGTGSRAPAELRENPRSAKPRMVLKKSGMKKMPMVVANSIPKKTPVPSECRLPAPAPLAMTSGDTPRIKANEVIRMGRKRSRPPRLPPL